MKNIISHLRDEWRPAVSTVGFAAMGSVYALNKEPLYAVAAFAVAAVGATCTLIQAPADKVTADKNSEAFVPPSN